MTSIADLIAASTDTDLRARVRAAADARGLPLNWTDLHMGRLVAATIPATYPSDGPPAGETNIAAVYGYKLAHYAPAPRPGEDPAAVIDPMIWAAIDTINGPTP